MSAADSLPRLPRLLATSVVRGARQGESHGGVYLIDFEERHVDQPIDWNAADIDWQGRGWDRGLRGIAFDTDRTFIAASDELFAYDPDFRRIGAWRSPYLKHCHEISRFEDMLYLSSTGFDSVLAFDLRREAFTWGLSLRRDGNRIALATFDPMGEKGPSPANAFHLNSVFADAGGLFLAGLRTPGLLRYGGKTLAMVATLPEGSHNARPFRDGLLFNDTSIDTVRYVTPSRQRSFRVPAYADDQITHRDYEDGQVARRHFARGLCPVSDTLIAAGSSPSTVALHDLDSNKTTMMVTLSNDVRNAVHGLALWPF